MLTNPIYGDVSPLDLLVSAFILVVLIVASRIVSMYLRRNFKEKIRNDHLELVLKVINYGVLVLAILAVLPIIGIQISSLMVAGGIAGIVLGFASQKIVANLISGIFLIIERPIKTGDWVKIGGDEGYVEDVRIVSTLLRTFDGPTVRLPNEAVYSSNITNNHNNVARRVNYIAGIRYSDDADKAVEIIYKLLDKHPFILKNPAPHAFVSKLNDNSVDILIRFWTPMVKWYAVWAEMLWRIKEALEDEGIEIAFPQRVIWMGDNNDNPETPVGS